MELNLNKPIIFFDLETTGTNITRDRIVEVSILKIMPDGKEISRTRRINPEMPIPPEATAVHHITDADVAGEPTFRQIAKDLASIFAGCDIAGFNSNRFDIPMLDEEFQRAGIKFDFTKPRFYCGKELTEAHSADADTRATYEVLKAQLDHYDDLPNDIAYLSEYSAQNRNVDFMGRLVYDDCHREVVNFGKYKGRLAEEVLRTDPSYYNWIMQGDFSQNTKDAFTAVRLRMKTEGN